MPSCVSRASIEVIGSFYPLLVHQQEWHAAADQMILTIGHMLGCFASDPYSSVARPASSPAVVTSERAVSGEKRQDLRLGWLRRLRASGLSGARCVGSSWEAQGNVRAEVVALPPGHPYLCLPRSSRRPRTRGYSRSWTPTNWSGRARRRRPSCKSPTGGAPCSRSCSPGASEGRRSHPVRARRRMPVRRHAAGASH